MHVSALLRTGLVCLMASVLACPPSYALVSIDDGKNQLFVNSSVSYAWDSNIFASSAGGSDSIYTASMGMEYQRRAGLIGVNASLNIDASKFIVHTGENSLNPRFNAELTKETGRTTADVTLSAARESSADTAANIRTDSWSYAAGLNLKYPVIERYTLSGSFDYALRDYIDNSALADLATYAGTFNLYYVYNSERDIVASYRIRYSQTSANSAFYDHAFTLGLSGKILPKISGNISVGYQFRVPTDRFAETYGAMTASGTATWNLTKRMNASATISKDFSTTSTNTSVDTTALEGRLDYAVNSHAALQGGAGYGINQFLGTLGADRKDTYFTWNIGGSYTVNPHLSLSVTYTYFRNWSTAAFSRFERNSVSVSASSKF